jgi:hypothetical protein
MNLRSIDKFHKTRLGYLFFGLVELGLSYKLANLAIPSGDWWEWLGALIFLIGVLQNFGRMIVGCKQ